MVRSSLTHSTSLIKGVHVLVVFYLSAETNHNLPQACDSLDFGSSISPALSTSSTVMEMISAAMASSNEETKLSTEKAVMHFFSASERLAALGVLVV
ncbi:hypothetical protein AMTR_s00011p00163090 [Amborella trichopoda]|uniref:Uncharacterized protein n=1 Tax=Amborella trichopoda TaxID=13333 RepID=W1NFP4_AMBTC|nr:hypothetical protein AMTR_s00011p00163090 [Amborella trichopoda]